MSSPSLSSEVRYRGKNRPDLGLVKNEYYEVLPSPWLNGMNIRTGKGLEMICPLAWFELTEPRVFERGFTISQLTGKVFDRRSSLLEDGRKIHEIIVPGYRLTLVHK